MTANTRHCHRNRYHGFTLIEMVMVIVLTGIIAALGSKMLVAGFTSYQTSRDLIQAQWQGTIALERLSRDLRTIRSATIADLTLTPATQITFTDTNANVISYTLSGTTLMRNGQPLADGITSLAFSYIASDGKTTAATAAQTHYVVVDIAVSTPGSGYTARTAIHPRAFL